MKMPVNLICDGIPMPISPTLQLPLSITSLEEARVTIQWDCKRHFNNSGNTYGCLQTLNTAFMMGLFLWMYSQEICKTSCVYHNIADARVARFVTTTQPDTYWAGRTGSLVETYITLGASGSITNGSEEIVVEQDALLEFIKYRMTKECKPGLHTYQAGW